MAQIATAVAKTVLPFVDQKRMAEVEGINWLAATCGEPAVVAPRAGVSATAVPPNAQTITGRGSAQRPDGRGKSLSVD